MLKIFLMIKCFLYKPTRYASDLDYFSKFWKIMDKKDQDEFIINYFNKLLASFIDNGKDVDHA